MNMRMILFWALLQIPMIGYCSELRNYSSPERRFGSFSSVGKFEADCQGGGIRLHQFEYFSGQMGEGTVINSFPITDREWFNPREGTVGSKQLELVCFEIGNASR